MTATVIEFPRVLSGYRARCDECHKRHGGGLRILPTARQVEHWAVSHSRSYGHTVRLPDGRVFSRGMEFGREGESYD